MSQLFAAQEEMSTGFGIGGKTSGVNRIPYGECYGGGRVDCIAIAQRLTRAPTTDRSCTAEKVDGASCAGVGV